MTSEHFGGGLRHKLYESTIRRTTAHAAGWPLPQRREVSVGEVIEKLQPPYFVRYWDHNDGSAAVERSLTTELSCDSTIVL